MFEAERPTGTKPQIYRELALMAEGLFRGERDPIANAANLSALLWLGLSDLNWAGFYFLRGSSLVLGPFQGKPACVRIDLGKGVWRMFSTADFISPVFAYRRSGSCCIARITT